LEALRQYLAEMPLLPDVLLECLGESMAKGLFDHNNADELRLAYKEAQQLALERIGDREKPYYVVTFPQVAYKCQTCSEELRGAYYEISNPKTMSRGMFRVRLMHELIAHGRSGYYEPIVNMSDTLIGEDDHNFDVKKFLGIVQGLPVPPAVMADLQAVAAGGN
jgi:hypothetical protein